MQTYAAALAALLAAAPIAAAAQPAPAFTLEEAWRAAGLTAPSVEAATADRDAARAGRVVAGLRPNPVAQGQVENIAGSGLYRGLRAAESTIGVAVPIELGGKRNARIAAADAALTRAELNGALAAADLRLAVSEAYLTAVAADRRIAAAREQARIAGEGVRAAASRVRAGRASPLEEQRATVARIAADAEVEQLARSAMAAHANLGRRIGRVPDRPLDGAALDGLPVAADAALSAQPLAVAAADADLAAADAEVRVARAAAVPDLLIGPALRHLEATNDTAAVLSVSLPIPLFNAGRAATDRALAERRRADAQRRATLLNAEQALADAAVDAANALTAAQAARPALAAAEEGARIARIGYREGKFGQLDLLDAERTLAAARRAGIDATLAYHLARARLDRLTAPLSPEIDR